MRFSFLIVFISLFQVSACWGSLQADQLFLEIKDKGLHLENFGSICEEAAILEKKRQFLQVNPIVIAGIEYADSEGVVGELDVLVIDSKTNKVIELNEVKCFEDFSAGLNKAKKQSDRFFALMRSRIELIFYPDFSADRRLQVLDRTHFSHLTKMRTLGQKGALAEGYDEELPLTLSELIEVRKRVMSCQDSGECAPRSSR